MDIIYSAHAKRRMRERKLSRTVVNEVLEKADQRVLDTQTGYIVYIKRMLFKGKSRWIAVSIDEQETRKVVVSVHPIRDRDYVSRFDSGRWI